jgi:hypothetical protein
MNVFLSKSKLPNSIGLAHIPFEYEDTDLLIQYLLVILKHSGYSI